MTPQVIQATQASATYSQSAVNQSEDGSGNAKEAKVPWYRTRTCKVVMVGLGILTSAASVVAFSAAAFVAGGILSVAGLACLGASLYQALFSPKPLAQRTVAPAPQQAAGAGAQVQSQSQPVRPVYSPMPAARTALPSVRTLTNYSGHKLKHYDLTKGGELQLLQHSRPCRSLDNPVRPTIQQHPDGAAGVARDYLKKHPQASIALGIAGNSGKPGGALQDAQYQFNASQVNPKAKGQEEALFSEWLINECGKQNPGAQKTLFENTVQGQWGLTYGQAGRMTKQGRDYTQTTNSADYKDAWTLSDIPIFPNSNDSKVGFVVVAGPNTCANANDTTGGGSMANTLNVKAKTDYAFFKECVRQTLVALFISAKAEGHDVMLVPQISCGIYAGPWKDAMTGVWRDPTTGVIHSDFSQGDFFREILPDVLSEKVGNSNLTLGCLFKEVIVPALPSKSQGGRRANRSGVHRK